MNTIPEYTEEEKKAQRNYNKEYESTIDGIIRLCFGFFYSIAEKLSEEEINRFQNQFNKKQMKKIVKVTGDINE